MANSEMSPEVLGDILLEARFAKLPMYRRVEYLLWTLGKAEFEKLAWALKLFYVNSAVRDAADAARRALERGWEQAFPGQTMPTVPSGFWSPGLVDDSGIALARRRMDSAVPVGRIGERTVVGTVSTVGGYLESENPTWMRYGPGPLT